MHAAVAGVHICNPSTIERPRLEDCFSPGIPGKPGQHSKASSTQKNKKRLKRQRCTECWGDGMETMRKRKINTDILLMK